MSSCLSFEKKIKNYYNSQFVTIDDHHLGNPQRHLRGEVNKLLLFCTSKK